MSWGQAQIDVLVKTVIGDKLIQNFSERADYDQFDFLKLIVKPHERRKDLRIPVNWNLEICEVFIDNYLVSLNIPMVVRAIDLSSGGIRVASVTEIPETSFSFCFCLPLKNQEITCIAEVVSRERLNNIHLYGCHFLHLETVNKNRIRNFVFTEQIRLNRKKC